MSDRASAPGDRWHALVLEVGTDEADELIGECGAWLRGARCDPAAGDRTRLQLFLRADAVVEEARAALSSALDRRAGSSTIRMETVEDGRWVERYQASLRPFPLGERFQVFPDGRPGPAGERHPLTLIPGRAFGTGEHATTQGCVELLERHVAAGSRWIDLGCGSGILSLVAATLGAADVLAIEIDPEAAEVARQVLATNGAPPAVTLRCAGLEALTDETRDGLVANINAPIFLDAAARLVGSVVPGGMLIGAGFPLEHAPEVIEAVGRAGARPVERIDRDPWCAVAFRRDA